MSASVYAPHGAARALETLGAWVLALLWILPLAYAFWTAFHPPAYSTNFALNAPLTLANFENAWRAAPFARYFVNTVILVTMVLAAQLVLVTLAAYAFARFDFPGRNVAFALVLVNAVINAFRLVDHIVVMTRGGPDNATALLLYYVYEIGFRFWDTAYAAALTVVLLVILGLVALAQFFFLERKVHYQ